MKVTLHSQIHEWRENNEEGGVSIIRAGWNGLVWEFKITTKKDPEWHDLPTPTLEHYESLRDVLWRKYQRKRLNIKLLSDVDARLEKLRAGQKL